MLTLLPLLFSLCLDLQPFSIFFGRDRFGKVIVCLVTTRLFARLHGEVIVRANLFLFASLNNLYKNKYTIRPVLMIEHVTGLSYSSRTQPGYIETVKAQLKGIYGNVNCPCPRAVPLDSGRFTAINYKYYYNIM